MSYTRQMLDTYPRTLIVDPSVLAAAVDAISDCAQACAADTAADLNEQNLAEMAKCIRLCLDCTDVCTATGRSSAAWPNTTPTPPGRCWNPAWLYAKAAAKELESGSPCPEGRCVS
jgi:hypothetical protein